ncbi:MAG: hypothetical protein HOH80_10075 [Rhodospirillaceae bacterium]|jgi:hypothetical protein|nr:hypothetical protein [Rhodospirillaceae bacterium]MBT5839334.1 hypothetical protein [Rhodospirillaceae bacterium]MBT6861150.1 hypothetical protein [Rhodospirillaceae bacterium]
MPSERNLLPRSELKILFEYILDLREKTDPDLGPDSAKNKNYNAQQALIFGGLLFDSLIGWAANHQIGAITEDLLSEDRKSEKADAHSFEIIGQDFESGDPDQPTEAEISRQIISYFVATGAYVPVQFRSPVQHGLMALNNGEQTSLMTPSETGEWGRTYSLTQLRLGAIMHLFFVWGSGGTKKSAIALVADAFGASPHTVRDWERKLIPKKLGEVQNVFDIAKRAGAIRKIIDAGDKFEHMEDPAAFALYRKLHSEDIEVLGREYNACQRATKI